MNINIKKHIDILGLRVKDQVSGFEGIVSSVCFDLYGCIQACVHPGLDNDGKLREMHWFDIARLKVLDTTPVMELPDFEFGPVAEGRHGPSEKPPYSKS